MKKILKSLLPALAAALILSLSACSSLDVVGKESARAFENLLDVLPPEKTEWTAGDSWLIPAPDQQAAVHIFLNENSLSDYVWAMEVSAQPFVDAGLDLEKLDGWVYKDGILSMRLILENDAPAEEASPLTIYNEVLKNHRSEIGYHTALDHFNIAFGSGNMFEWAKDLETNDKDVVFVLNPEPFTAAGVDPNRVEGWTFAKVSVTINGKATEVDKLLKPFNLE